MAEDRYGEIVDNSKQEERIFHLHRVMTPRHHPFEVECTPRTQVQALPMSSADSSEGETTPDWWFYYFEPVWRPFIQRICRQKNVTLLEFERAASQVPGLTPIEKTIAISAFRQQQARGSVPSLNTTAFRSEHSLSVV